MFNEEIEKLKKGLNDLIGTDTAKETVDAIASLSKIVDTVVDEHKKTTDDYDALKDSYIKVVKDTAFPSKDNPAKGDSGADDEQGKTFAECLADAIKNAGTN